MTLTHDDIERLEKLGMAADEGCKIGCDFGLHYSGCPVDDFRSSANPAVVLALISRVREMEGNYKLGVGDGSGNLFVHGDYASVKAAQAIVLERDSLRSQLSKAERVVEAARECLWVDECRCDVAYTGRGRHEPNTRCGELDPIREALREYDEGKV